MTLHYLAHPKTKVLLACLQPSFQISYSQANDIPFLGTGGGHGYSTTLSVLKNGIQLDLGLFNVISIDAAANTITVGGSVIFADVFPVLQTAGKELRECASRSLVIIRSFNR